MKQTFYERIGESVYREVLPNGLQVCVVPKPEHAKKYAFFATRYGGMDTRFCLDGKWLDTPAGIAHYLEHKMFDTKEGNALQELAKNGAEPNAFTSNAMTGYYFDSTEHFEENLEILLSFVSIPYFTEESVAKEQGIIGQEIRMIEDNPDWQLYTRMMQALYQKSTARTSIAGTVESISHITAETLYDCHKAFYTPSNMVLTVAGDVEPEEVVRIAREILPKEPGGHIERDYGGEEDGAAAKPEKELRMEVSTPIFQLGFKAEPAPAAEEKAAPEKGREKEKAKPAKAKAARKKAAQPEPPAPQEDPELTAMRGAIKAIVAEQSDEDGWLAVSMIGNLLVKRYPDFDVRNFGFSKLTPFVLSLGIFEVRTERGKDNARQAYVRLK